MMKGSSMWAVKIAHFVLLLAACAAAASCASLNTTHGPDQSLAPAPLCKDESSQLLAGASVAGLGQEESGLKIYALLVKLPHLTMNEFDEHWRHPHGTLAKKLLYPYLKKYVQNHALGNSSSVPGFAPIPYDGIPTVWVERAEDLEAAANDPRYAEIDADVDKLYERSQIVWLQGREYIYISCQSNGNSAASPVKVMLFFRKSDAVEFQQFQSGLGRMLRMVKRSMPDVVEMSTMLPPEGGNLPYDAIVEIAFATESAFKSAWEGHSQEVVAAVKFVADMDKSGGFLAKEERVIWSE